MKRILLSLMMVVATLASATAAETVIDCTTLTWAGVAEKAKTIIGKSGDFTITIAQETGPTAPTQNGSQKDVRAYSKNSLEVVSASGNMTTAVFKISTAGLKRLATSTVSSGTLSYDAAGATVTWAGSAASFTITVGEKADLGTDGASKAGQICFNTITINTGVATGVSTPSFSPAGGTFYEAQNVAISCATAGATIYYTTDGTAPTTASSVYAAPIEVSKMGDTVIKALAVKEGLDNSTIAEATYTIADAPTVANIAAFLATNTTGTATGEKYEITSPVTVLYHGIAGANTYLFVKDETDALQVFSKGAALGQTYETGDVIPAGITGSVDFYGKAAQMVPVLGSFAASTSNVETKPMTIAVSDFTADVLNQLVIINNATVDATAKTITDETGTMVFYNRFEGIEIPTTTEEYNITAIANTYNGVFQIFPTKFDLSSGVTDATADATTIVAKSGNINISVANNATAIIFNAAGQVVAQKAIVAGENTIEVAGGFYIVKVGNTVAKVIVK